MHRPNALGSAGPQWLDSDRLWTVAALFFLVGDAVTTVVGLGVDGIAETGPVAAYLLERSGLGVLVLLKVFVFGGAVLVWKRLPRPYCGGIPIGLAVVGVLATGWNVHVIAHRLL